MIVLLEYPVLIGSNVWQAVSCRLPYTFTSPEVGRGRWARAKDPAPTRTVYCPMGFNMPWRRAMITQLSP